MGKSQRVKMLFWVGVIVLSAGWAGCLKTSMNPSNTAGNKVTYIVLMNLAPYSPATEIYLNDMKSTNPIPAGAFSTSYTHIIPAVYDVKFKVAGGDSLLSEIPSSSYDSLSFYTLMLYNDSVKGPAKSVKIIDNYSAVTAGNTYFRFFHMCPEVPALDLYIDGTLVQQARTSADILKTPSDTWFQTLPPNFINLQFKKAGTDSVLFSVGNTGFTVGNAYTIFLSGSAGNAADPIGVGIIKASY